MSRAYRISVKESLTKDLAASDEICSDLEILDILPREQMAELLRGELKGRGFKEEGDKLVRNDEGVTVSVDPTCGEVSVKSERADSVELQAQREDWGYDDAGPGQEELRRRASEQLKQDLERRAAQQQARLQTEATEKLEGRLGDVRKELSQVVNRITAEALKRKAASLGQIKEMTEDPESGSLTITVEV
jgi:FtsH ternary system domain X5